MNELELKGKRAKKASYFLSNLSSEEKNNALRNISKKLVERSEEIIKANSLDIYNAMEKGTSKAMLDRLSLDKSRIEDIAQGVLNIVSLNDPIGEVTSMFKRPNGLKIGVQRVPIGVIGIIYEARPNVTVDAAALCLKSGNAVILRGGKEAINSNLKIVEIMNEALKECSFEEGAINILEDTSREIAKEFMKLNKYLDVLILRGGAGLIKVLLKMQQFQL